MQCAISIPPPCCILAFPVSKLEGKRNAIVGLLESGCTEPTGMHVLIWRAFLQIGYLYCFACLIFEDVLNHAIMCIIIIIPICLLHPSVNITHYTDMSVSKDVNLLAWALCESIYSTQEDFF